MKKKFLALLLMTVMALQLGACSFNFEPTCKESGCEETDIYEEGYCKYHYLMKAGENVLKDFIN